MKRQLPVKLAVTAAAAALVLAACGGGGSDNAGGSNATGAGGGQVLTIGMPNGTQTNNSNPFIPTSASRSMGYGTMIYEPLAQINQVRPTTAPEPWLATEWKWNDDFTSVELTIRDGVKWSDGQDLTAEDVKYSLQLRKDNAALNADALPYDQITLDGKKVTVTFKTSQYVNQQKLLNLVIVPEHIWKDIKDPSTDLNQTPIGSGPYVLKTWTTQGVTLTPNESYWGDKPQVPELRYTSYNDNTALTTALVNGDVQWGWTFIADYKSVYVDKNPDVNKVWYPTSLAADVLFLNTTKAPFNDPAMRKAVSMVIDREAISTQASSGVFPPITSVTGLPDPAGTPYVSKDYTGKTLTVDVEGAKKVLADAGYTLDGDTLKDKSGNAVTFTLSNPAGWSDYLTGLQIIAQSVKQLGITADVQAPNADTWTTDIGNGNFDASLHWTDSGATPWNLYANMMDGQYLKPVGETATWNFGRYDNAEATAALAAYANATNDADRTAALATVEKLFVEETPAIPTTARPALAEYSTKNFVGWPTDDNPFATPDPTQNSAAWIVLHLKPAS